jgi:hypothetical protein
MRNCLITLATFVALGFMGGIASAYYRPPPIPTYQQTCHYKSLCYWDAAQKKQRCNMICG